MTSGKSAIGQKPKEASRSEGKNVILILKVSDETETFSE